MTVIITKDMSSEEVNKIIQKMNDKKDAELKAKKAKILKELGGSLKRLDKSVDEVMKEVREGWL